MQKLSIECPRCGLEFAITEALARPVVEAERNRMEVHFHQRSLTLAAREKELLSDREQLDKQQKKLEVEAAGLEELVQGRLKTERLGIAVVESKRIEDHFKNQLDVSRRDQEALEAKIAQMERDELKLNVELAESRRVELDVRKQRATLDDEKRLIDLEVERRVDTERQRFREAILKQEESRNRFKLAEKEKVIDDMRKQVEVLRQRGDQGSQQLQGEVQELELEAVLRSQFPGDEFESVAPGRAGADLIQKVTGPGGADCGTILWESKRTKQWGSTWLSKTRENQRSARASLAVIVSTVLPRDICNFDRVDDVWVSSFECINPLTKALRTILIQTNLAQVSERDRSGKTERIYSYVTSPNFKHRVSSIVDAYLTLKKELDKEKRFVIAGWERRGKYHEQIMFGVEGMDGDLQGIVGESMPEIESLDAMPLDRDQISLATAEPTPSPVKELAAD